jgi:hypothetical protein
MRLPKMLHVVVVMAAFAAGCGGDPVGDELQDYWGKVVVPACRLRDEALSQFKGLGEKSGGKNLVQTIRDEIGDRLARATKMLSGFHGKSAIMVQANGLLEANARELEQAVEEVAKGVERANETEMKAKLEAVTALNKAYLEIMSDLSLMGLQHGLDLNLK